MDYSFYGGRKGASFVIAKSFESVEEMVQAFSQGGGYTLVKYDEYVIIDSPDRNDPDNGKLFKRGYDFNNELGGAIYLCQIVGPQGGAPGLIMDTVEHIKTMPNSPDDERFATGEYTVTSGMVPGKEELENGRVSYNDAIEWASYYVRDEFGIETLATIGFTFPYQVTDFTVKLVDAYVNEGEIERIDDKTHPFYAKWQISVPKGLKGDALNNLRIGKDDENRDVLIYDQYDYSEESNPEPTPIILGDYNMISNIALDDNGTLTVSYTHEDNSVWRNKIKWIDEVSLNQETGDLEITFNIPDEEQLGQKKKYTTNMKWINSAKITDGNLIIKYNDDTEAFSTPMVWVKNVELSEDGVMTFTPSYGSATTQQLKWIKESTLSTNGLLSIVYNNDKEGAPSRDEFNLKWPVDLNLSEDGKFKVAYVDAPNDFKNKTTLKWPTDISLDTNGDFVVSYNDGTNSEAQHIKWPTGADITEEGAFSITYNNGDKEETTLKWPISATLSQTGDFVVTYNNNDTNTDILTWIDSVTMTDDGTLTFSHNRTDGTEDIIFTKTIKWVTGLEMATNGELTVTFNTGETETLLSNIKWINDVDLDDEGTLTVNYNTGQPDVFEQKLSWVTGATFEENGNFSMSFNNSNIPGISRNIKWINDISVNTGNTPGAGSQKLQVRYNNSDQYVEIGNPLNYILETAIRPSDYHLLVLYSDPEMRAAIVAAGKSASYRDRNDWHDLGAVKSDSGVMIGKNMDASEFENVNNRVGVVNTLNGLYPNGLTGADLRGKIIAIGLQDDAKDLYAFNYERKIDDSGYKGWFYLGTVGEDTTPPVQFPSIAYGGEEDADVQAYIETLPQGSVWFVEVPEDPQMEG